MEVVLDEFFVRLMRAIVAGGATLIGLLFGKVGLIAALTAAGAVGLLLLLDVFRRYVMPLAGLAVLWGALVATGIAPSKEDQATLMRKGVESAKEQLATAQSNAASPLAAKLEELKATCDKGLLDAKDCEAAHAKILADFTAR